MLAGVGQPPFRSSYSAYTTDSFAAMQQQVQHQCKPDRPSLRNWTVYQCYLGRSRATNSPILTLCRHRDSCVAVQTPWSDMKVAEVKVYKADAELYVSDTLAGVGLPSVKLSYSAHITESFVASGCSLSAGLSCRFQKWIVCQ